MCASQTESKQMMERVGGILMAFPEAWAVRVLWGLLAMYADDFLLGSCAFVFNLVSQRSTTDWLWYDGVRGDRGQGVLTVNSQPQVERVGKFLMGHRTLENLCLYVVYLFNCVCDSDLSVQFCTTTNTKKKINQSIHQSDFNCQAQVHKSYQLLC